MEVRGHVDAATAPVLSEGFETTVRDDEPRVIVDLGGVSFIDSRGIQALLEARRLCEVKGGELILARLTAPVRRVLEIAGLFDHFDYAASPSEVLEQD